MKNSKGFWCREEAARVSEETGLGVQTVIDYWKLGRTPKRCVGSSSRGKSEELNLRLAVMESVNPKGYNHTLAGIAEVCGTSKEAIRLVEQKALRNLRSEFAKMGLRSGVAA